MSIRAQHVCLLLGDGGLRVNALEGFDVRLLQAHAELFVCTGLFAHGLHGIELIAQALGFCVELGLDIGGLDLTRLLVGLGIGGAHPHLGQAQ